jgi:transcriptional regulator with XRE-family HTH domain
MEFSEWLVDELDERGWSRSEAARRGGISASMLDKVINGHSKPGVRFIEGIAKAFKMSSAEVMMHVSKQKTDDPWIDEMEMKLRRLSPGLRSVADRLIDGLVEEEESNQKTKTRTKSARA